MDLCLYYFKNQKIIENANNLIVFDHTGTSFLSIIIAETRKQANRKDGTTLFMYGMRLRPFSIGCQPMEGLARVEEDNTGKYWNILFYANPLNDHEQEEYELDYLGESEGNNEVIGK